MRPERSSAACGQPSEAESSSQWQGRRERSLAAARLSGGVGLSSTARLRGDAQ